MPSLKPLALLSLLPTCLLERILSSPTLTARDLTSLLHATACTPLSSHLAAAIQSAARLHLLSSALGLRLLATKRPPDTFLSLFYALNLLDPSLVSVTTRPTSIWSCGRNHVGQAARHTLVDTNVVAETLRIPTFGPTFTRPSPHLLFVAAGANHSACLTVCGHLHVVGENHRGQLGLGHSLPTNAWTIVPIIPRVCQVACGAVHTVVLTADASVLVTGANDHGQLGLDSVTAFNTVLHFSPVPQIDTAVVMVAAGNAHTLLLTAHGRVFGAGDNSCGQLGGKWGALRTVFQPVHCFGRKVVRVACGGDTTMMLTTDNMVLVSGKRKCGWSVIGGLGVSRVTHLSVGERFAIARTAQGDVAVSLHRKRFCVTEELRAVRARCVSAGTSHYSIVTEGGRVLAAGGNAFGQVGSDPNFPMGLTIQGGHNARIIRPYRVPLSNLHIPHGYRALQVAAGAFHTMFLLEKLEEE